jgi:transcriptional regulatory protein RtcR
LKSGIETKNQKFNLLIEQIEHVAINSSAPLLLAGPTGAGKSRLAKRIYELKKVRKQVLGQFVEVNCATLRGDAAMSALFGHVKGSFTGALKDRPGLLKSADKGVLLLDEIGELGTDEQAMLLRALEEKRFLPVGSDKEVESSFQLICGTNRDLKQQVREGNFREDLLARINLWAFNLPGLRQRPEDIEPNIEYELDQIENTFGKRINFNKEAKQRFLEFAVSSEAIWSGNFRDLNGAIVRMATLVSGGRITIEIVQQQIDRLKSDWAKDSHDDVVLNILGKEKADTLDLFDRVQLTEVIKICRQSKNISDAGRILFACSRQSKANCNDADRIRKYLARFGLSFQSL